MSISKKCSLAAATAAIAFVAMAGSAFANNGAEITTASPKPVTGVVAGAANTGGVYFDLTNCYDGGDSSCVSSGGVTPTKTIGGVNGVQLRWSTELKVSKSKAPICTSAQVASTTLKQALIACGGSQLGSGQASVCVGAPGANNACGVVFQAQAVVFRGPDVTIGDKTYPGLLMYANLTGSSSTSIPAYIAPESVKAFKDAGFKTVLNVFGSGSGTTNITDFAANLTGGIVKTKCLADGPILFNAIWDMVDAEAPDKASSTSVNCDVA